MDHLASFDPEEDVERRKRRAVEGVPKAEMDVDFEPDPAPDFSEPDIVEIAFWNNNDRDNLSMFKTACDLCSTDSSHVSVIPYQVCGESLDEIFSSIGDKSLEVEAEDGPQMTTSDPSCLEIAVITTSVENPVSADHNFPLEAIEGDGVDLVPELPNESSTDSLKTPLKPDSPAEAGATSVEQEHKILARISELRKQGRWEDSRIPKCVVPELFSRGVKNFTKEVCWVATLIGKEKKAKIMMARKLAYAAKRWHEKKEELKERQQKEEIQRMRKIAKQMASAVLTWWSEVRKVAQMKQREEIEIQKKRIRDLQLRHLMDQTEEYSKSMAKGLAKSTSQASFQNGPANADDMDVNDIDFDPDEVEALDDEEETISEEEEEQSNADQQQNEDRLLAEANEPLENLLPPEYLQIILSQPVHDLQEPPSKKRRTSSRNLSSSHEEPRTENDLSSLVDLVPHATTSTAKKNDNAGLDEKIRSYEAALEKLRPKGNSLSSTEVVTRVPFLLRGQLREYQHVGLDWLVSLYNNKMNGILADEMGLGKTIQTIAFLAHLAGEEHNWGPHLVIVPTSVLLNWELEFKRWCPGFIIKTYYGSRKQRADLRTGWTKPNSFHVCITSYKIATQDYSSFRRMRWSYLILDEAQAIKNYKSQRWTRIAEFPSQRRLLLTGTPMQNSLEEVWALLHFLAPQLFESLSMFQQLFANPVTAISEGRKPQDSAIVKHLHTVLRPFILRRMKAEVETQLPKKYEHLLHCRLSKRQRYLYEDYMSRTKTKETLKMGNYLSVINILMQLRKVCNHPNLFEERPVLSPLVCHPLMVVLPSLAFDALREVPSEDLSPFLKRSFWSFGLELRSTQRETVAELLPKRPLIEQLTAYSRPSEASSKDYPRDFGLVLEVLGFSMVDLTAGEPFLKPAKQDFSKFVSIHSGKTKKSRGKRKREVLHNGHAENGKHTGLKRFRSSADFRISTKYLTESVIPEKLEKQQETHLETLDFMNRAKCAINPNIPPNVIEKLMITDDITRDCSYQNGSLRCRSLQERIRLNRLGNWEEAGLASLVVMGSSVDRVLDVPDTRFWIERASVAYAPVLSQPPILSKLTLSSDAFAEMTKFQESLEPTMKTAVQVLHPVERLRILKFPETRLIQYDCGKLQMLSQLLRELFVGGHRALIFTQMTKVLDILEIFLTYHGYKYLRLDGTTGVDLRQTLMDRFNRDARYFCFILSTRSGGVGVNLTGADTVIFYDSDWNPTMDAQAQDRCHRIGQTRDVHIYRLISESTVEESIYGKANQKRFLGHLAIESGGFTTAVLKKENFKVIFNLKDDEEMPQDMEDVSEAALESALTKAEDVDDVEAAKKAKAEATVEDDENDDEDDDDDPKFKAIVKILKPIQCYGVKFSEAHVLDQDVMDELAQTREEVERRKKEWELMRLEAAKAEKAKALEEASAPYVVDRSLLEPKVRQPHDKPRSSKLFLEETKSNASKATKETKPIKTESTEEMVSKLRRVSERPPALQATPRLLKIQTLQKRIPTPESVVSSPVVAAGGEPLSRSLRGRLLKPKTPFEPGGSFVVKALLRPPSSSLSAVSSITTVKSEKQASSAIVSASPKSVVRKRKEKEEDPDFCLPVSQKVKSVNGKNPKICISEKKSLQKPCAAKRASSASSAGTSVSARSVSYEATNRVSTRSRGKVDDS